MKNAKDIQRAIEAYNELQKAVVACERASTPDDAIKAANACFDAFKAYRNAPATLFEENAKEILLLVKNAVSPLIRTLNDELAKIHYERQQFEETDLYDYKDFPSQTEIDAHVAKLCLSLGSNEFNNAEMLRQALKSRAGCAAISALCANDKFGSLISERIKHDALAGLKTDRQIAWEARHNEKLDKYDQKWVKLHSDTFKIKNQLSVIENIAAQGEFFSTKTNNGDCAERCMSNAKFF